MRGLNPGEFFDVGGRVVRSFPVRPFGYSEMSTRRVNNVVLCICYRPLLIGHLFSRVFSDLFICTIGL